MGGGKFTSRYIFGELDFGNPATPDIYEAMFNLSLRETNLCIIRNDSYKLVHFNGQLSPLLFDMQADPNEMNNLADNPEFTEILLQMTQKLLNHKMKHNDHTLSDMLVTENETINYQPN